jgi:Kef-type K+ transport system membrane component KefB
MLLMTAFTIQVCFIIIITRLLQYPCALLRQPQVIAEVFTGVIVGPTVMGQIPGFTDVMFPSGSMASLNLASSIGLILFVFIVGLGLNPAKILRYAKETAGVSLVGTFLPFALGAVASFGLITQMEPEERQHDFGIFAMFCGMAMSITAFPMLARVSSELGLVKTAVGSVAIGAAAVNDALARCILVLFTALAYAYNLLDALYVLLAVIAYIAILTVVGRPILVRWFLPRFYNPDNGPSQLVVTVLLIVALLSSFFTQVMGFGAALGAFAVGVIVPHDGGLAVKLVEKIEDLVLVFFLPLVSYHMKG